MKGVHLKMAYGAPFWVFGGLWLLLRFQSKDTLESFRRAVVLTITIGLFLIAGFLSTFYSGKQVSLVYYPMYALGKTGDQIWQSYFPDTTCAYITSNDNNLAGFAAYTMSVRPSVVMWQGTWADDDDLNRKGGMIVWERENDDRDMPESLRRRFPSATVLPEAPEIPYNIGNKAHVLKLGIALVSPPEL